MPGGDRGWAGLLLVAASNGDPEEIRVQPGKNLQEHRL